MKKFILVICTVVAAMYSGCYYSSIDPYTVPDFCMPLDKVKNITLKGGSGDWHFLSK